MFTIIDYLVFCCVLLASVLIGVYFGVCGNSQTAREYLLGGTHMNMVPLIFSLIATCISGVAFLALPADVYFFGVNYVWICVSLLIICTMGWFVYLPVLSKLKEPSIFEYINLRFDKKVRVLASALFTVQIMIFNPVVAYLPALALSEATGIDVHLITVGICTVCIFYTAIGGFKAVVWTDAIQFISMSASSIAVLSIGVASVGGFAVVWEKALNGSRLELDLSLDITIRDGFWPIVLGGTVQWMHLVCLNPGNYQKYICLSTLSNARTGIAWLCCALIIIKMFSIFIGLIIYAKYEKCDPFLAGEIIRSDQIVPHFVMDLSRHVPGLPGVFTAGIVSGSLSSLSSMYNALAATVYADFLLPFLPENSSENRTSCILKIIVVATGFVCTIFTWFVDRLGGLWQYVNACQGLMCGIFLGLFSLGMLFPMANSKGAFWGSITGFVVVTPIVILSQWYKLEGAIETFPKPVSTDGCDVSVNLTWTKPILPTSELPCILFRISVWYLSLMAAGVVTVAGLLISYVTKKDTNLTNSDLISPISQFLFLKDKRIKASSSYDTIDTAFEIVSLNKGS